MAVATEGIAIPETANFTSEAQEASTEMSAFAHGIYKQKYSFEGAEEWPDTARRVVENVLGALGYDEQDEEFKKLYELIRDRKVMPAGRYLHAAGREIHQTQNCFLARAEDNREGWADLGHKAFMVLQTGGGFGVDYSNVRPAGSLISKTGGTASGPLPLMNVINEIGRGVMAGGSRRSAIIATLNWNHGDIFEFIRIKDWPQWLRDAKADDMTVAAPMDMTNISVGLDDLFFEAYNDPNHSLHTHAKLVYEKVCDKMLTTAEPGFTVDIGENAGENLRNPCQPGWAKVLTPEGIREFKDVEVGDKIWSETGWTTIVKKWSTGIKPVYKYETTSGIFYGTENHRLVSNGEKIEASLADSIDILTGISDDISVDPQAVIDGLMLGDGTFHKASNKSFLIISEKDQDYFNSEISNLLIKARPGVGTGRWEVSSNIADEELVKTYDRAVPDRYKFADTSTVASFLRGLFTANGSIAGNRVTLKATSKQIIEDAQLMLSSLGIASYYTTNKARANKFSNGTYDMKESYDLNVTVDKQIYAEKIGFIQSYKTNSLKKICEKTSRRRKLTYDIVNIEYVSTEEVFDITVDNDTHTYWTQGVNVSNCGEVTSSDDSDVCNLTSLNMARFDDIEEFEEAIRYTALFMLAGTVYSDLPYDKIAEVRQKNRRLGMGIMGLHEWLVKRGYKYEPNEELADWLEVYRSVSRKAADRISFKHGLTNPVKVRAIAPTGTISIIGETTSGIEPIFAVAYKRRVRVTDAVNGDRVQYEYVVDPTAKRLIDDGADPNNIEDAYTLAYNYEKRIQMQAFLQQYVDHAISVTVNLPYPITDEDEQADFRDCLLEYLPQLRGFTAYPDGSRGGQPISVIPYEEAIGKEGVRYEDKEDNCVGGVCGS